MVVRKTELSYGDYVRCFGCGRLAQRELAERVAGRFYGPECARKALMSSESPFICKRCGNRRRAEDMTTFDTCNVCAKEP